MRRIWLSVVALGFTLFIAALILLVRICARHVGDAEAIALDQRDPGVRFEIDELVGRWCSISIMDGDRGLSGPDRPLENYFMFSGESLIWYSPIPFVSVPEGVSECSPPMQLRLDTRSFLKILDIVYGRSLRKGLYRLEDDTLQIVLAASGEDGRPATIEQQSGRLFLTLKRAKLESVEFYEKRLVDKDCNRSHPGTRFTTN